MQKGGKLGKSAERWNNHGDRRAACMMKPQYFRPCDLSIQPCYVLNQARVDIGHEIKPQHFRQRFEIDDLVDLAGREQFVFDGGAVIFGVQHCPRNRRFADTHLKEQATLLFERG
ncbi:hypothetical protein LP421_16790 [Rhizobium sp. RCAM05350]|nr:hypothetical protein LP421_16790 [Rhizobium sp. RCAM05350]